MSFKKDPSRAELMYAAYSTAELPSVRKRADVPPGSDDITKTHKPFALYRTEL
jgi:hypothetical protein